MMLIPGSDLAVPYPILRVVPKLMNPIPNPNLQTPSLDKIKQVQNPGVMDFNAFCNIYNTLNAIEIEPQAIKPLFEHRSKMTSLQLAAMMTEVKVLQQEKDLFTIPSVSLGTLDFYQKIPAQVLLYLSGSNGVKRLLFWKKLANLLQLKTDFWRLEDLDYAHRENWGKAPPRLTLLSETFSLDMETALDYGATINPPQGPTWLRRLYHRHMSTTRTRPIIMGAVNFNLANADWPEFLNPYDPTTYLGDLAKMPSFRYVIDDELFDQ